ncbi:MAG: GNAT family N-acetyltransferase [Pseudomonadota bacterium]
MQNRTSEVHLRAPVEDDFDQWSALWRDYLAFYNTYKPTDLHRTAFGRLLSSNPTEFNGLVAERNGRLVGLVHFLYHRHLWRVDNTCYLQDLYVEPTERGTGLGRRLIEAVYAAADAAGSPSVYWLTQDFNANARKLYDRVGVLTPFIRYNRPA